MWLITGWAPGWRSVKGTGTGVWGIPLRGRYWHYGSWSNLEVLQDLVGATSR